MNEDEEQKKAEGREQATTKPQGRWFKVDWVEMCVRLKHETTKAVRNKAESIACQTKGHDQKVCLCRNRKNEA